MHDVRLWDALHDEGHDAADLAALLDELLTVTLPRRAVFGAAVARATLHRSPKVRAAAVRALSGCAGKPGLRAVVERLDDNHKDVRAAAVAALAACCTSDPTPFSCALFHRRRDVRRAALASVADANPVRTPPAHAALLLADPEHADDVRALLDARAADGAVACALLNARRLGLLDVVEVHARLRRVPFAARSADVLAAIPFPPVADAHLMTPEAITKYLTSLVHTDPLADILLELWRHPPPPPGERRLSDEAPIVDELLAAKRALTLKDPAHRRFAVCAAQVMLTTGESTPRMLALCALSAPMLLLLEADAGRRRAALRALVDLDLGAGKAVMLKGLVTRGALNDDAGALDAELVAGALRLLFDAPYQKLREVIPAADVAAAFWRAPSTALLSLAPRSPADREAYRALARAVIIGMRARLTPELVAALCVTLPADGAFSLADAEKGGRPGVVEQALALLLDDSRALDDVGELAARRLERNAGVLAGQLSDDAALRTLSAVVGLAAARPPASATSAVSPATATPARVDGATSGVASGPGAATVASATRDAVLRAFPPTLIAAAVAALAERSRDLDAAGTAADAPHTDDERDADPLGALVTLLRATVLPVDVERAWAEALSATDHAAARAWAAPRRSSVHNAPRACPEGVAATLVQCPDAEVPLVASLFLREPLTGLVDALSERAARKRPTSPSARLSAALLACHDPPHVVAEAFQGLVREVPPFLAAIDATLLDEDTRRDLPLLATAWVQHDAGHAVRFEQHCRTAPGGLRGVVDLALALPAPLLSWKLMRALVEVVRAWTYQRRALLDKLDDKLAEVVAAVLLREAEPRPPVAGSSLFNGARALRRLAADLVALAHASGKAEGFVEAVRDRLLAVRPPPLEPDVRARLGAAVAFPPAPPPPPRAPVDVAAARLRLHDAHVARAAVDELGAAGPAGRRVVVDALASADLPLCARAVIERAIFDDEDSRRLLRDEVRPEVRFRVALRLGEHKVALAAACAPRDARGTWLDADDVAALSAHVPPRTFALELVRSPHPAAYTKAVWSLLSSLHDGRRRDGAHEHEHEHVAARRALRAFLEAGDDREPALRAEVAAALLDDGDLVLPVVVSCALSPPEPRHEKKLRDAVPAELWREVVEAAGVAGDAALDAALESLMDKRLLDDDVAAAVALHVLKGGVDAEEAAALFAVLRRARWFDDPRMDELREAVRWGVRQARTLLGKPVGVEFIHDALGYTRLHQPRIFINPMPLLRGERGGDDVVRGLMVHEVGHHLYHADALGRECWEQAQKEKIAGLLNLVADEHLERNLRAQSDVYGDSLKVLASYAFQHVARDVFLEDLLRTLGPHAARVLTRVRLFPGRRWGCVHVELGRLLAEISAHTSFARFMRALRQGLGGRDADAKVREGLALFSGRAFRASKMDALLDIARELHRIFGDETGILETFGIHETMETGEEEMREEGFSPDELQRELDRDKSRAPPRIEHPKWNDGPDERFDVIDQIVPLAHRPEEHRALAAQGRRATRALRSALDELGTRVVVERRRLSGRSLDRQGLASAIARMDPRLLVRRTPVPAADLFVGLVVDCSGSMASDRSMDKARVFATSLAEAARGNRGVDVRIFGFTSSVIYDAGDAERCAAHALQASGGNNDAAGLWHAAVAARRSRRPHKLLVMVSDGLPTECSAAALRALANRLERGGTLTAQVAVRPLKERCFKHYVEILGEDVDDAGRRFARVVSKLVRKTTGGR